MQLANPFIISDLTGETLLPSDLYSNRFIRIWGRPNYDIYLSIAGTSTVNVESGDFIIRILCYHNGNYLPGAETIVIYLALKLVEYAKRGL